MKNNKIIKWLMPGLFALLFILFIRVANDVTFDVDYIKGNSLGFILKDTVSVVAAAYFCSFFLHSWLSFNLKRKRIWLLEYGLLALFTLIFCLVTMYISWGLNGRMYAIKDVAIPVTIVELFIFWVYTLLRNKAVQHENDIQHIQLEKIKNDKLDTELKLLKAQYHPHFLFNALNTIYFQIDENNPQPRKTIEILSDLLRYQLYNDNGMVEVKDEINYMKGYINLWQIRSSERLKLDVSFDEVLAEQHIYPLLFVPLIENAFKYVGRDYTIKIDMYLENHILIFSVENSMVKMQLVQPQGAAAQGKVKKHGLGLENLRRRLELLYKDRHCLDIKQEEGLFKVNLSISI